MRLFPQDVVLSENRAEILACHLLLDGSSLPSPEFVQDAVLHGQGISKRRTILSRAAQKCFQTKCGWFYTWIFKIIRFFPVKL